MDFARSSSLRSGVFTAIGGLLAITAGVFVVLILSIGAVRNDERLVNQTDEVRHAAAVSERAFEELESGLQAFLLTGQRRFLAPYTDALAPLADDLRRLETLTRGDRKQNESARAIAGAVSSYESSFALPLAASSGRFTHARNVQIILKGERLANTIRGRLSELPAAEALRTERSRADAASSARTSLIVAAGGFALLVLLLGALTAYLSARCSDPHQACCRGRRKGGPGQDRHMGPGDRARRAWRARPGIQFDVQHALRTRALASRHRRTVQGHPRERQRRDIRQGRRQPIHAREPRVRTRPRSHRRRSHRPYRG